MRIGEKAPYFEFLDGIKGKSVYDLRQKYHLVIYNTKDSEEYEQLEEEFEKLGAKLIDYIQIITKDFCEKFGCEEDKDFIYVIDRFGTLQYRSIGYVPPAKEILDFIFYIENEGCCAM